MNASPKTIVIVGPTAGGKTELAIELAGCVPGGGECICADSMQIYREMDIGTAKPTPAERARVPHHLLDMIDPADDGFSVDAWLRLATEAMRDIAGRGRVPIVVGGTNLYIQALLEGMFDGPEPNDELRRALQETPQEQLYARLESVDPDAAQRIHRNDRKRTVRAVEVYELTGTPISALQQQWNQQQAEPRDDLFLVGLEYPAEAINRRINARVKNMFDLGFREEVRRLHEAGRLGVQASEALGYKQMIAAIGGEMTEQEAIEQIKIQTRRYARKQRTWLKRFRRHRPGVWLEAVDQSAQELCQRALSEIMPWPAEGESGNRPAGGRG